MTATEFPYLYKEPRSDAVANHEEDLWDKSFRENVACARAIEKSIREHAVGNTDKINQGCAASVIAEYGYRRVEYVLAYSIQRLNENKMVKSLLNKESVKWAKTIPARRDDTYGRYYEADTAVSDLEEFLRQEQECFRTLLLFGSEHCSAGMYESDVTGKVLVMDTKTLSEKYWSKENQLWLAESGFGCDPKSSGRAIYATCLGDGEKARWNREDFVGVLDEKYLPDWAKEKLAEMQETKEHDAALELGGMNFAGG